MGEVAAAHLFEGAVVLGTHDRDEQLLHLLLHSFQVAFHPFGLGRKLTGQLVETDLGTVAMQLGAT